jgi:hypothetical protein
MTGARRLFARSLFFGVMIPSLSAQAWLSPKGEGTVSLSYQNISVHDHAYANVGNVDIGHILSHAFTLDADYSITNRLAVRIALPYAAGKYDGSKPHQLPIDDGDYHPTFQDFTIDLRYNLTRRPVLLTPFFRAVIPSHDYEYFAHSAVGRDLREYHAGLNVGRRLNPILPKAYFQARYAYAFVEKVVGISPNRSNAEFQLGYFVKPRFSLLGMGQWMYVHQGVDLLYGVPLAGLTAAQFPHHDQISKASLFDLGAGAAYSLSPAWQMYSSWARSLTGQNGHLHAGVFTVGVSRSFGTRFAERIPLGAPGQDVPPAAAIVCTCAKGN